ncbi:MAG: hypothetical protein ACYTHJ_11150 [Planctomycetota bacterium]|jgi:hypothetical protein
MSDTGTIDNHHHVTLSFSEKLGTWLSCGLAIALFVTFGWIGLAPEDPLGPLTMAAHGSTWAMFVQALALTLVATGLATVISGRNLLEMGTFAACIGLTAVSLRGGTGDTMLLEAADAGTVATLGARLAWETFGWSIIILSALAASAAIARWCFGTDALSTRRFALNDDDPTLLMAGCDFPSQLSRNWHADEELKTDFHDGWRHSLVTFISGLVVIQVMLQGFGGRAMQHGQSCFVVAATVGLAAFTAHRLFPVRSALWTIYAALALAFARYLGGWISSGSADDPIILGANPVLRILPIHFTAVGTATAILMFWQMTAPPHQAIVAHEASAHSRHENEESEDGGGSPPARSRGGKSGKSGV